MCTQASIMRPDGSQHDEYGTIGELAAVMPAGLVFADYFAPPRSHEEIMSRGDRCLCPVDFAATAARNGYTAEWEDDSRFFMVLTPIAKATSCPGP